ncbi:MAG TPA: hypothetical protein VK543_01195 [Puia sp.]|nr:hypothetical protein [Puia sp.]
MLEKGAKILSILGLGASFLGFIKLFIYYNSFNINVINYINASELIFTLLPVVALLVPFLYGWSQWTPIDQKELTSEQRIRKYKWFIVRCLIVMILLFAIDRYFESKYGTYQLQLLVQTGMYVTIGFSTFYYPIRGLALGNPLPLRTYLGMYALAALAVYQLSLQQAISMRTLGGGSGYSFKWRDKVVKTDSNLFVIGETQSYVFLYQRKDSATLIYNRSEIDSMVIRKR